MRAAPCSRRLHALSIASLVGWAACAALASCQEPLAAICQDSSACPRSYTCVQGHCRPDTALDATILDSGVTVDAAPTDTVQPVDTSPVMDVAQQLDAVAEDRGQVTEAGSDAMASDASTLAEAGTVDGVVSSEAGADAGDGGPDGGQPPADAGVLPADGGSASTDGSLPPPDAGSPSSCGTVQALHDDFTVAHDEVLWWDWEDPGAALDEAMGVLRLDFAASQNDAYAGKESAFLVSLRGGTMRVEVRDGLVNTAGGNSSWFRFSVSHDDRVGFHVEGDRLWAQLRISGQNLDHDMAAYDPAAQRWWQLRESQGQVHFEVSTDGLSWNPLYIVPTPPFADRGRVQIGGGHYDALASADRIEFASFNAGLDDPGWCAAHTYQDAFDVLGADWSAERITGCTVTASGSTLHLRALNQAARCHTSLQRLLSMKDSSVTLRLVDVPLHPSITTRITLQSPDGGLWWEWGRRDGQFLAYGERDFSMVYAGDYLAEGQSWIRIRRTGGVLSFDVRHGSSGASWTTVLDTTIDDDFSAVVLGVDLRIAAAIPGGEASYEAVVDSLNLDD